MNFIYKVKPYKCKIHGLLTENELYLVKTIFISKRTGKPRYSRQCKKCNLERSMRYKNANPEKVKAYSRKHVEEHREERRKKSLEWNKSEIGKQKRHAAWLKQKEQLGNYYIKRKLNWNSKIPHKYITNEIVETVRALLQLQKKVKNENSNL